MLRRCGYLIFLSVLVFFSSISAKPILDTDQDPLPFSETGHWVGGEFLEYYLRVEDPKRLFGLPITEPFEDPYRENITIQYFERVRMELDSSKPKGERISLANLGEWLYDETQRGPEVPIQENNALCQHFPQTDKYVCYGFLQLYERYQGEKYFGQPVSNAEYVNDHIVQYFENVRMEWRNELPVNQKVVLTEIGRINYQLRFGDSKYDKRVYFPKEPVQPIVRVFVDRPLLAQNEDQKVTILVRDQYFNPVEGAIAEIKIKSENSDLANVSVPDPTDEDGLTEKIIRIPSTSPNQEIDLQVTVRTRDMTEGQGSTWFRIWW